MPIDTSPWDGNRAMTECKTAADYNKVCAGKKAGDPALRSSHKLPHHYLSKYPAPNVGGVTAALQRFDQTEGLTNRGEALRHLENHRDDIRATRSARPTIERRTSPITLELREDGRTLAGRVMPYNTEARIGGFTETFRPGAFADADPAQIPLMAVHDHESLPIGRALSLTDGPTGLDAELRVSKTRLGDEVLELVRDGAATGLSVGFIPVEDRWNAMRTVVERIKARLVEISVTSFPAYQDARILAVREEELSTHGNIRTPRLTVARYRL